MLDKEITFDRFVRGGLIAALLVTICWFINYLSAVLLPFFMAWFLAYLLYPIVIFFEKKCHLRNRVLSIIVTILLVSSIITAGLALVVPPTLHEADRLFDIVKDEIQDTFINTGLMNQWIELVDKYLDENTLLAIVQEGSITEVARNVLNEIWSLIASTYDIAMSIIGLFMVLLYMFFILLDYERICWGFLHIVPESNRDFVAGIFSDVETGMNAYFRGQGLIAFLVGVLFSIGFLIIDFPMAITLGLFIGLLNMVPYLQLVGFLPATLLAFLKASDTGQSFWAIMAMVLVVFCVVQVIQDVILTPRIMGKAMGLNPAVILLSLSVWGSLLGFIGLIIALPLTTLVISYYRRYVLKENRGKS